MSRITFMPVRAHIFITGKVQGVTFRSSTRRKARKSGVTGWVRNLPDGRVEAVLEGEERDVKKVINWCHTGPTLARVEKVDVDWEEFQDEFDGFEVKI